MTCKRFDRLRLGLGIAALIILLNDSLRAQEIKAMPNAGDAKLSGQIYSPAFCPNYQDLVAYERQELDQHDLLLYNYADGAIQTIRATPVTGEKADDPFTSLSQSQSLDDFTRYEGQLDWRPEVDDKGRQWFVFVSNGGAKSYDLYLSYVDRYGKVATEPPLRLSHEGVDQYPKWSPDGNSLVFVSGDKSGSDLFLATGMDNLIKRNNPALFVPKPITTNPGEDNYPAWSPDGKAIAYEALLQENKLNNMGVSLINNVEEVLKGGRPQTIRLSAELSAYHEYKPAWNAKGNYLAYYVSQGRVDQSEGNRLLDVGVLTVVTNAATKRIESGRVLQGSSQRLTRNVVPNANAGPTWGSDCDGDTYADYLFYVKRDEPNFNPIFLAALSQWQSKKLDYERSINVFSTKLHRDVTVTRFRYNETKGETRFAFASQVQTANRLQVHKLDMTSSTASFPSCLAGYVAVSPPVFVDKGDTKKEDTKREDIRRPIDDGRQPNRTTAVLLSAVFPGGGQFYSGKTVKGFLFTTAAIASAATFFNAKSKFKTANEEYDKAQQNYLAETSSKDKVTQKFNTKQNKFDQASSKVNLQKIITGVGIGVWALNVIDSFGFSGAGARGARIRLDRSSQIQFPQIHVSRIGDESIIWLNTQITF